MSTIKFVVETNDNNSLVYIRTFTDAGDSTEERAYSFNPTDAVSVANSLLHAAELCGVEVQVQTSHPITSMQRLQLINRTQHIMRTMSRRKPEDIAVHITDSILAAIL